MTGSIVLIRHARPTVDPDERPSDWALSAAGATDAQELGLALRAADPNPVRVMCSTERKAIETARHLALGAPREDARAGEVTRPWYDDATALHADAATYLAGAEVPGWEPIETARARFDSLVADTRGGDPLVVVSHGTVMAVWVASVTPGLDPVEFWRQLQMPDAWRIDLQRNTAERIERARAYQRGDAK